MYKYNYSICNKIIYIELRSVGCDSKFEKKV